jgi:magnesium chelatase subunit D
VSEAGDSVGDWREAVHVLAAFALVPEKLGGVRLRMPAGPVRETLITALRTMLGRDWTERRLPVSAADEALLGGPDLAASLEAGRLVRSAGLLASERPTLLVVPMADRMDDRVAGHVMRALETPAAAPVVCLALDEGRESDERPPEQLCERLAITVDLSALAAVPESPTLPEHAELQAAQGRFVAVTASDDLLEALCEGCARLGITSLRAPLFALSLARAHAALAERSCVDAEDVAFAARYVLGPRARAVPAPEAAPETAQSPAETDPNTPPPESHAEPRETDGEKPPQQQAQMPPEDLVVAAARAALPPGLLASGGLQKRASARRNGKSGASKIARRRGRPLASRPGRLSEGRLDLLATLKAAVPWQALRTGRPTGAQLAIRRGDIHIKRYRERSESLTIFAVDASGSTAAQRLAEAKGAVELLLAECYVRRDQVALISFRKREASVLLPPTRSLARAGRLLAEMPAGGGTPLAAAITAASAMAEAAVRAGLTPLMVFLTDAGANIARDGTPDRPRAENEARQAARAAQALGHRAIMIDVARRDRPFARELCALLGARHVLLPRADAASLARVVGAGRGHR